MLAVRLDRSAVWAHRLLSLKARAKRFLRNGIFLMLITEGERCI